MISIRPITNRDAWLAWRKECLTASDIAAVAGVDPYKTAYRVYAEKLTDIDVDESAIMRRGRMFEHAAYGYLQEDHPTWEWMRPNAFYEDVDLRLGCTPDALAVTDHGQVNVQIKTVSAPTFEAWDGKAPTGYLLQTACENMLTKSDRGILAVMVVSAYSAEIHEFEVPRHKAAERRICDICRTFWQNAKAGLVPLPNYKMDADIVTKLYPPDDNVEVPLDLDSDNRLPAVLQEREILKAAIKEAGETVSALDAEIVHKLNGATLAYCDGWKITNRTTHRGEFTVAAKSFPVLRTLKLDTVGAPQ